MILTADEEAAMELLPEFLGDITRLRDGITDELERRIGDGTYGDRAFLASAKRHLLEALMDLYCVNPMIRKP